jgi:glutamate 5-kinase
MKRLSQRTRYLNAVNALKELLSMGVVPIVNENDTVSVSVGTDSLCRSNTGLIVAPGNQIR